MSGIHHRPLPDGRHLYRLVRGGNVASFVVDRELTEAAARTRFGLPARTGEAALSLTVGVTCHAAYLDLLPRAIASIEAQTVAPCQKIVALDDCELPEGLTLGDDWQVIAGQWHDANPARNEILASAGGSWITWVDADNEMPADYVVRLTEVAAVAEGNVAILYGDLEIVDADGQRRIRTILRDAYWQHATFAAPVDTSALWRVEALRQVGGWPTGVNVTNDDWGLSLQLRRSGWEARHAGEVISVRHNHAGERRAHRRARHPERWLAQCWDSYHLDIVVLLAGRSEHWEAWSAALAAMELPPHSRLVVVDNSRSAKFGDQAVRKLRSTGLPLVWLQADDAPGPDELDRHRHVCRLYDRVVPHLTGDLVLTWEDDVLPPGPEAVRTLVGQLLRQDDWQRVGAVAATYEARPHPGHATVGGYEGKRFPPLSAVTPQVHDVTWVPGGFTLWPRWNLHRVLPWRCTEPDGRTGFGGWDVTACTMLRARGLRVQLAGMLVCEHRFQKEG